MPAFNAWDTSRRFETLLIYEHLNHGLVVFMRREELCQIMTADNVVKFELGIGQCIDIDHRGGGDDGVVSGDFPVIPAA